MEGERVGFPHAVYRACRRNQREHAISRDGFSCESVEPAPESAERIEGPRPGCRIQEGY